MLARTILNAAAIVTVAVLIAGCGGGSDNDSSNAAAAGDTSTSATTASGESAPTPEKAELIKQADAGCEKGRREAEAQIGRKLKGNPNEAAKEKIITSISLPAIEAQADELRALDAPSGDEEQIEAIAQGIEDAVAAAEKNTRVLSEKGNPFVEVGKLASAYGFQACGRV